MRIFVLELFNYRWFYSKSFEIKAYDEKQARKKLKKGLYKTMKNIKIENIKLKKGEINA